MKNSKISSHEIVDVLSAKASISKRAAEDFIKVLFTVIEDELLAGESVKIKNLGTFKLQWNEPRKSVNVQTGQEIILSGYNKVVFNPDEKLKELVNKPFAHLEAVVVGGDSAILEKEETPVEAIDNEASFDPLKVFSDQALEIKDLISEIQSLSPQSDAGQELDIPLDIPEQVLSEESETELEPISEPVSAPIMEEVIHEEVIVEAIQAEVTEDLQAETVVEQPAEEPIVPAIPEPEVIPELEKPQVVEEEVPPVSPVPPKPPVATPPTPKKKSKPWLVPVLVLVGLIVLVIGTYFLVTPVHEFVDSHLFGKQAEIAKVATPHKTVVKPAVQEEKDTAEVDTVVEKKVEEVVDSLQLLFDSERVYDKFIATEKLKVGNRLAKVALHYYGCRDFWVYIYEANKSKFPDPDEIPVGATVKIPKVDARLIDASNPRCIKKAKELHDLYKRKK
jgi:nucleoid DNA-binding protein/nucleoid-associated protein YgaU